MIKVDSLGIHYDVSGDNEVAAAAVLEEGLSAVTKRRNAYVQSEIDDIIRDIVKDYGVEIKAAF